MYDGERLVNLFRCDARDSGDVDLFLDLDLLLEDTRKFGEEDFLLGERRDWRVRDDFLFWSGERDLLDRTGDRDLFLVRVTGDFFLREGERDLLIDDDNGFFLLGESDFLDTVPLVVCLADLSLSVDKSLPSSLANRPTAVDCLCLSDRLLPQLTAFRNVFLSLCSRLILVDEACRSGCLSGALGGFGKTG